MKFEIDGSSRELRTEDGRVLTLHLLPRQILYIEKIGGQYSMGAVGHDKPIRIGKLPPQKDLDALCEEGFIQYGDDTFINPAHIQETREMQARDSQKTHLTVVMNNGEKLHLDTPERDRGAAAEKGAGDKCLTNEDFINRVYNNDRAKGWVEGYGLEKRVGEKRRAGGPTA